MAEKKEFNDTDTNKKQRLDWSTISMPDLDGDKKERYNKRITELGLDQKEFVYDQDELMKIKNINEYPKDSIIELEYWISDKAGLSPDIFDSANEIPSLRRLELFRWGYAHHFDMMPYIKYQNEYDDDTLLAMMMYNLYLFEYDENGNTKKYQDGSFVYQTLPIPDDSSDRRLYFANAKERLICEGFSTTSGSSKEDRLFERGYSKDTIDLIITGYINNYDVIKTCEQVLITGIIKEMPDESTLQDMIKKQIGDIDAEKTIESLYDQIYNDFVNDNKIEIIKAKDLNLVSIQEKNLIEQKAQERIQQEQNVEDEESGIIDDADEVNQNDSFDMNSNENDLSGYQNEDDAQARLNALIKQNGNLEITNEKQLNDNLVFLASQGNSNKKDIAEMFDKEIRRLSLMKEAILRSLK